MAKKKMRQEAFQKKYWERDGLEKRRHPAHPCIREYVLPKIREIKKSFSIAPQTKILEVGCGNGFFSYYFEKICSTVGVDYSKKMIQLCPIKKKMVMDANKIAFRDSSFDLVFSHALLHHTQDPLRIVKEMLRVSRSCVVLLEPNRNNPLMFLNSLMLKEERLGLRFSLSYLKNIAGSAGLEIRKSFSYGLIIPNKSPVFLIPLLRLFNFRQPWGMTNFIIAEKKQ